MSVSSTFAMLAEATDILVFAPEDPVWAKLDLRKLMLAGK
jgi:hypothetical protein